MTALRMALTELLRVTGGPMRRAAVIAMVAIPTLYGGLYLYANHDPYGRLDHVPAALVVLDRGSTLTDGTRVDAGREVADQLQESRDFDWHVVSPERAAEGIRTGDYDFGLTIPRDFSAALTSSARFDPRQAQLQMTTNDANSYLSTTIADTVTGKVRAALAARVGTEAAQQFLLGLGRIRGSLQTAASGADQLHAGLGTAGTASGRLATGADRLAGGARDLAAGLDTLRRRTAALPAQSRRLAAGARQVAAGDRTAAGVGDRVAGVSGTLRAAYGDRRADLARRMQELGLTAEQQRGVLAVYDRLGAPVRRADDTVQRARRQLDRLAAGAARVAAGADRLAAGTPALAAGIGQADAGARRLATGAETLGSGARRLDAGLARLEGGSARLASGLHRGLDQIPAVDERTRDRVARTIGNPVRLSSSAQSSAGSYGAGLAPFFLALATWIGGYVLFLLVRPLSARAMAANQSPVRVALGGWLTPALLGVSQMVVMLSVVTLGVHIRASNLAGTLLFLALMSATFVAIVHALNAWLGVTGQFLGLVLLVLQLVTAGGTFPWQTIPQPLYPLHHVLPMSYAVDGLRQLMYGGLSTLVTRDVLVLVCWLLVALLATSYAARRQRVWTVKRVKPELAL
jgi:putative membrane protein